MGNMGSICPECKTKYYYAKLTTGESFANPPIYQEIEKEERFIKKYGMCRKCYNKLNSR